MIIPHDSTASTTLAHRPLAHALFSFSCRAHSHAYRVASIDLHDRERSHAMMLHTMHVVSPIPAARDSSRCRRSLAERCTVRVLHTARNCLSPVSDTRCARLRLASRRCRAHACSAARLASSRHVHMWALPRVLAERYHDTVRVQTCSQACDLSSSCANVPAGLLHLHALSSRSSDCMPRVFTCMRRVPAGLITRRSRLRAASRRCPAAACMPVLLAS